MKIRLRNVLIPVGLVLAILFGVNARLESNMKKELAHVVYPTYVYLHYNAMVDKLLDAAHAESLRMVWRLWLGHDCSRCTNEEHIALIEAMTAFRCLEHDSGNRYSWSRIKVGRLYLTILNNVYKHYHHL